MAIDQKRYVDITSGVAGATQVARREYIARLFTTNSLLPPQTFVEFTSAADVGAYFGLSSQEYLRSVFYFSWISKSLQRPQKISFGRWVNAATAPMIYGYVDTANPQAIGTYTSISTGSLGLTIGGVVNMFTGIDLTAAVSLADVATAIQTKIRTATGTQWTAATVVYDAVAGAFVFTGGSAVAATISVQNGSSGTDLVPLLHWLPAATITNGQFIPGTSTILRATTSPGSAIETPVQAVNTSADLSTNFGSFAFIPTALAATLAGTITVTGIGSTAGLSVGMTVSGNGIVPGTTIATVASGTSITLSTAATISGASTLSFGLSLAQATAVATWNKTENVRYEYQIEINSINASSWQTALKDIGGTGLNLGSGSASEYIEMFPMMIQAATDYDAPNSVVNYEFQQTAGLTPTVTTDAGADAYDAISVNYYGQTQQAGQLINFYQQGKLQGLPVDPLDMNTYANEIWLKDEMSVALMNLLLAVERVPANAQGRSQLLSTMQPVINQALNNGTISVGKTLTTLQKSLIFQITNDANAWYQVQNSGYWVDLVIVLVGANYVARYTLVYSKDDVIRKVEGRDVLI